MQNDLDWQNWKIKTVCIFAIGKKEDIEFWSKSGLRPIVMDPDPTQLLVAQLI